MSLTLNQFGADGFSNTATCGNTGGLFHNALLIKIMFLSFVDSEN